MRINYSMAPIQPSVFHGRFGSASTSPPPLTLGWRGFSPEQLATKLNQLSTEEHRYNSLPQQPYVYTLSDDEKKYAKSAFISAYGQDFYDAICQKRKAVTEGEDMACASYDPETGAVFVLSKYDYDGARGAKLFFDETGSLVRIEQKSNIGPFKNAGEYLRSLINTVIHS